LVKIAASILSADFARLGAQVQEAEAAGADLLHVDVMDGHFVPPLTMGPLIVEALRRVTQLPLDVHLMVENPAKHIPSFASAGATILTIHAEACPHLHRDLESIKKLGVKAGVSVNPGTPAETISEVLSIVDLVLVMSVDPGFGGQPFLPIVLPKLKRVKGMIGAAHIDLSVDGGINAKTAKSAASNGATVLVAGSAVFGNPKGIKAALEELRNCVSAGD
jgi:ribulose-phosphate 3-epimerase